MVKKLVPSPKESMAKILPSEPKLQFEERKICTIFSQSQRKPHRSWAKSDFWMRILTHVGQFVVLGWKDYFFPLFAKKLFFGQFVV